MKSKFLAIVLLLLPWSAFSQTAGWSGKAQITSLYAVNNDQVLVKLTSFNNPGECETNGSGDVVVNPSTQETWFTLILSAYMAKKDVNIFVGSGCTPVWSNTSYANVGHVLVTD